MSEEPPDSLISDANVLIDFAAADMEVLGILARSLGRIHVARDVLREVKAITEAEARRLGLLICEPSLEEIMEASIRGGALSTRDKLCLAMARTRGWACLTNDHSLRKKCTEAGVRPLWGLEALLLLVRKGHLSKPRATKTAHLIRQNNPHHITEEILVRFLSLLADI